MVLPQAADDSASWTGEAMRLFVGDDWSEDRHDVEVMDEAGRVLAKKRLRKVVAESRSCVSSSTSTCPRMRRMRRWQSGSTGRGPWVAALIAAGYTVYPVNPLQASRYRDRPGCPAPRVTAGTRACWRTWCTDSHQLRPAAGDSPEAAAVKVVARTHKTLIWERTRAVQRLRHQLREYFPAALAVFEDLDSPTLSSCWARPPTRPARGS